jgi:hypothetical protein
VLGFLVDVRFTRLEHEVALAEAGGRRWSCAVASTGGMRLDCGWFGRSAAFWVEPMAAVKEGREGEVALVMESGAVPLLLCSGNLRDETQASS